MHPHAPQGRGDGRPSEIAGADCAPRPPECGAAPARGAHCDRDAAARQGKRLLHQVAVRLASDLCDREVARAAPECIGVRAGHADVLHAGQHIPDAVERVPCAGHDRSVHRLAVRRPHPRHARARHVVCPLHQHPLSPPPASPTALPAPVVGHVAGGAERLLPGVQGLEGRRPQLLPHSASARPAPLRRQRSHALRLESLLRPGDLCGSHRAAEHC
mmetsp:Transcript_9022/g.15467  ORF Transcript_9022/g.15467 Transcript_9022/m.15467 type:complete len:216 (-) Transcript_9022:689-1336(-)